MNISPRMKRFLKDPMPWMFFIPSLMFLIFSIKFLMAIVAVGLFAYMVVWPWIKSGLDERKEQINE